ncbi:MAG: NADPH-dependent assimilatory sulfite reductase hemoprotein subunit [FCB group bacterium]|jgi:sulfite reductase beta subunit-like hemoprotein|nr:NADPH-dependent assimilatory sulfite reductase hemoprotein subunit [FCB group bacterium]
MSQMSTDANVPSGEEALSKVEGLKVASRGLYGPLVEELGQPTPNFSDDAVQILKHHGSYQQDDRDTRTARKKVGLDKDYKMMVRTKFPAGQLSWEQYLICDDLATKYGQDDMRITSRQDFQFHGVLKKNLRNLVHDLNRLAEITTFGGCGDVVRNTTGCPVADIDLKFKECGADLMDMARKISAHFLPKTHSYYDLWLDDEKVEVHEDGTVTFVEKVVPEQAVEDPIYGITFLPRKFKIGITADFDNSIDVYTNDVGIMAVTENGRIAGYEILAGGGLGFTQKKPATYPRLATHLAFVQEHEVIPVLEAIVKVQRDNGGRSDRRHSRMKYLIDDIGLDAFRAKVEEYYGKPLTPTRNTKPLSQPDYLGWSRQIQDGLNYVGVWVENGRVRDFEDAYRFRSGLRAIVERFHPDVRLTAHHNIIFANIRDEDVAAVQALLDEYGLPTDKGISTLRRLEMACPALPLCGLAMSEAERALPGIIKSIEEAGHGDANVIIRMSGCPNNCSRPRSAELGLIGNGTDRYHVYTGGDPLGTRLCDLFMENVHTANVAPLISQLFDLWKAERGDNESFGDWSAKKGVEALRASLASAEV